MGKVPFVGVFKIVIEIHNIILIVWMKRHCILLIEFPKVGVFKSGGGKLEKLSEKKSKNKKSKNSFLFL